MSTTKRVRLHAEPEPDGRRPGEGDERHERRDRADGRDAAHLEPAIRVAEEYAMLDCISGGRLVAGLPLGSRWT